MTAEEFDAAAERAQSFLKDPQFIEADRNIARCYQAQAQRIAELESQLAARRPDREALIAHFRSRMTPPFAAPETLTQEGFIERWNKRADNKAKEEADALLSSGALATITALKSENERLRGARADLRGVLAWYEPRVANCRKITSEGNDARRELDADGGQRARAALAEG